MGMSDFPTWFGVGSYGGLACTMLAAGGIAAYALLRRRGSPRQLARAVLVCLFAGAFMLASVWWNQNRLELYGPSLAGMKSSSGSAGRSVLAGSFRWACCLAICCLQNHNLLRRRRLRRASRRR